MTGRAVSAVAVANDPNRTSGSPVSIGAVCGFGHCVSAPTDRCTVNTEPLPGSLVTDAGSSQLDPLRTCGAQEPGTQYRCQPER